MPLQILSTGLGKVRSCTLEWMNSSGKRLIAFAQLILSTFRSFQHSMSSVTVYTHLCMMYVYLEVYVHMIAHVSTRCNVCVGMHTSRLDDMMMRVSRRDSHVLVWYRDDEWCWESRLDFMICVCISTRFFENLWDSRLENLIRPRLEKCVDSQIFMPVGLTNRPSYGTLAKSTIP